MYKIYVKVTLVCFPALIAFTYGDLPECHYTHQCNRHDKHAICLEGICVCVNGTHRDVASKVVKCNPGTTAKPQCDSDRPCSSHAFICTPWGICDCRLPGYKAELLFSRWQCIQDPFLFEDRGTVTFLKVSPVPLLVVVIIVAYFGYQHKAKLPPPHRTVREVNRLQQRRIVPLWRGVTFHPTTIATQAAQPQLSSSSTVARAVPSVPQPRPPSIRIIVPQQPAGDLSPPPPYQAAPDEEAPPSYDEAMCATPATIVEHVIPLLSEESPSKS
ncbi:uncharacterized protein LOC119457442 isoform X5 [Dermacentor silvarum]|uniref:uncharacterized protein LOC119457442 isoform X5 n=1 Tax=Dermacentor silvarum TaxID=543639 RepID=UPI0021010D98|nr:uncharacterized protein LOC119457442 isoform X5 [Dermacentor silvarum]